MVLAGALCCLIEGLGVPALVISYITLSKSHSVSNVLRPTLLFSHGSRLGKALISQQAMWSSGDPLCRTATRVGSAPVVP